MSITYYFLSLWQKSIINFIKLTTMAEENKNKIQAEQLTDEQLEQVSGGGGEKPEPK